MRTDSVSRKPHWEVTAVRADGAVQDDKLRLAALLTAGWEPFAATPVQDSGYRIHLRRLV